MKGIPLFLMMLTAPGFCLAESAQIIPCKIVTLCDENGNCQNGDEEIVFTIAATTANFEGAGGHEIRYWGIVAEADSEGWFAPYVWATELEGQENLTEIHVLMVSGAGAGGTGNMLWQVRTIDVSDEKLRTDVHFLECEFPE